MWKVSSPESCPLASPVCPVLFMPLCACGALSHFLAVFSGVYFPSRMPVFLFGFLPALLPCLPALPSCRPLLICLQMPVRPSAHLHCQWSAVQRAVDNGNNGSCWRRVQLGTIAAALNNSRMLARDKKRQRSMWYKFRCTHYPLFFCCLSCLSTRKAEEQLQPQSAEHSSYRIRIVEPHSFELQRLCGWREQATGHRSQATLWVILLPCEPYEPAWFKLLKYAGICGWGLLTSTGSIAGGENPV